MAATRPDRARVAFWNKTLAPHFGADTRPSIGQLVSWAVPFFGLWALAHWALDTSYWLTLLFALGAAGDPPAWRTPGPYFSVGEASTLRSSLTPGRRRSPPSERCLKQEGTPSKSHA